MHHDLVGRYGISVSIVNLGPLFVECDLPNKTGRLGCINKSYTTGVTCRVESAYSTRVPKILLAFDLKCTTFFYRVVSLALITHLPNNDDDH